VTASAVHARTADPMTALEIVTGVVYGQEESAGRATTTPADPRVALEVALRAALLRPPCVVAFSGGRDSSILLAVAVGLARREGLDLPIAVTVAFPDADTQEVSWQDQVLLHLDVPDRVLIELDDELDVVGPLATRGLSRHGLLYPANAHFIVPLARAARDGTVITGLGGDDVFGSWQWRDLAALMAGRRRPRVSDLRRAVHSASPLGLRAEIFRRRQRTCSLPWLREPLRRRASLAVARELAGGPRTWAGRMTWLASRRVFAVSMRSIGILAGDEGARVSAPLLYPGFLAALAQAGGRWGWGGRTATMRALFADVLPDAVLSRPTKAEFSGAFFGHETRRFAHDWNGDTGVVDPDLVDADALRSIWSLPKPHFLSSTLLQASWLTSTGSPPALAPSAGPML
jgi:hypothetical protein